MQQQEFTTCIYSLAALEINKSSLTPPPMTEWVMEGHGHGVTVMVVMGWSWGQA